MTTTLSINGNPREVTADPSTPLLWVLRQDLGLTGTKFGCGMAQCGACTVQVDGVATRSCVMPIATLAGKSITTIEATPDRVLRAVIDAWVAHDVAQCGYCQPGQVMAASALLRMTPSPDEAAISAAMNGNVCRCGSYPRIRSAVLAASKVLAAG